MPPRAADHRGDIMGQLASESPQPVAHTDEAPAPQSRRRLISAAPRIVRIAAAAAVALYFLRAALVSDNPLAMFVGLFPIAWIAVEFAWVTLRPRAGRNDR